MKQKKEKEEGEHEVSINVTIAKASITEKDADGKRSDVPQVQNYFHCEYKLLPDDQDFIKTDIVSFGMAAKMYGDNDSKVLRTWIDGDKTWIAWTNSRKIRITHDVLLKIFHHKFELKVWDTKDKVSAKARFDRPKAFRLPQTKNHDEIDLGNIRDILSQNGKEIIHLGNGSSSLLTQKKIEEKKAKKDPKKKVSFVGNYYFNSNPDIGSEESSHHFISTTDDKVEVKVRLDKNNQPQFKNLLSLASSGDKPLPVDTEENDKIKGPEPSAGNSNSSNNERRTTSSRSRSKQSSRKTYGPSSALRKLPASKSDHINQNGLASIAVPLSALFTNCLSIDNNLKEPISSLDEVIVILTLDKPLLSEYQRYKLNPMVLTVKSANQLPKNGMSYEEMRMKCHPPYIKYNFHGCKEHRSLPRVHGKNIKFNDSNVLLLGTFSKSHLFEYLRGPSLKIEIHDRDIKDPPKKKSSVFGSKPEDDNISNTSYVGGNLTNLLAQSEADVNYGVAEFDLSELLSGERMIHTISPIRACKKSNATNQGGHHSKSAGIPVGDYLESGSELKIVVELVRSLIEPYVPSNVSPMASSSLESQRSRSTCGQNLPQHVESLMECPYSRIIYIFDYHNKAFLGNIMRLTTEINAKALDLSSYPMHVIEAALSTYKLTDTQKRDSSLDIITGCQVIDGDYHIFILEGLSAKGVKRLWDELEHPKLEDDGDFRVLYNSNMTFAERMYISLDVDLIRIRLHQPISNIVKQPLLYIRDILPRKCFLAVTRLHQLSQSTSLQSVVRNEVLPTVPMIISLGREFGVPLTEHDLHEIPSVESTVGSSAIDGNDKTTDKNPNDASRLNCDKQGNDRRPHVPLDMTNEAYDEIVRQRKLDKEIHIDYINANIKSLLALSRAKSEKDGGNRVTCDTIEVAHNYSSQKLNSTALAMEKLRQQLSQDDKGRYTYCPDYNSATFTPINTEEAAKMASVVAKEKWKTNDGFIFPGMKSSKVSNEHPQQLHPARLSELEKPWRENILHANISKPSVDRLLFKWVDREADFDTSSKPPVYFVHQGAPPTVTIHAAGDTLKEEQQACKRQELQSWKAKQVVADPRFHTYRCLVATELTGKGFASSNQIDRKRGLLKDAPQKISFARRGFQLEPIPHTESVFSQHHNNDESLSNNDDSPATAKNVGFHPGDSEHMSWSRDINSIPIRNYEHTHFEKTKGRDFRVVHTDREKVGMKIAQLTKEEKATHLFL